MPKMPRRSTPLERLIDDLVAKGTKAKVASDDEAANCDFVICLDMSRGKMFPDNALDFCCKCATLVQLRPHVPRGPKRICYSCASKRGDVGNPIISQKTADDFAAYLKKRN